MDTSYSGHVEPGGPAISREAPGLRITKISVGPVDNEAYVLECTETGEQLLIDAANEADRLLPLLPRLTTVVTTHRHPDHWQALADIVARTGAAVTVAHQLDAEPLPVRPSRVVEHGETIQVGRQSLGVIHLRGHTPGSIALLYAPPAAGPHLFTGDCLFPGGPGRTTNPETFTQIMNDLEERVFGPLPDSTWIYPGHGDDTTIGSERSHLAEWRARGW